MDSVGKATLLAETFTAKHVLPNSQLNKFTHLQPQEHSQEYPLLPTVEAAEKELASLNPDSGTGPDHLPAKILKYCAKQLALPIALLTFRIIAVMHWPEMWITHWLTLIFGYETTQTRQQWFETTQVRQLR